MKSYCPTNFSKSPNLAYHVNQLCILIIVLAQLKKGKTIRFYLVLWCDRVKKKYFFSLN
jgi:hypothetical protein